MINFGVCLWTEIGGGLQLRGAPDLDRASNSPVVIFDESKDQTACQSDPKLEVWAAPPSSRAKENEKKPERWCDVKVWDKRLELLHYQCKCLNTAEQNLLKTLVFVSASTLVCAEVEVHPSDTTSFIGCKLSPLSSE